MDLLTNGCFDLDAGTTVSCSDGGAISSTCTNSSRRMRSTRAIAGPFSARFTSEPSYSDCKDAGKDTDTFDPAENRWYCSQTADDNYGWIKVRDTEIFSLEFDWTTW